MEAAPRVHDGPHHPELAGALQPIGRDLWRVVRPRLLPIDGHVQLLAERFQLVHRGGTAQVGRDEQRPLALPAQVQRELGSRRRLARALQADKHDRGRRRRMRLDSSLAPAQELHHLVVDELDHLLAGRDAAERLVADRLLADGRHELPRDPEVDVRLQQGQTHLAQGLVDVAFGQAALVAEASEDGSELVSQRVEHAAQGIASLVHGPERGSRARPRLR